MMWETVKKDNYVLYKNNFIDLKVKVYTKDDGRKQVYMNYKGYNLTTAMLVWEFGEYLDYASIRGTRLEGQGALNKSFVISGKDLEKFIDQMCFFLTENNMDSVLRTESKINPNEDWD